MFPFNSPPSPTRADNPCAANYRPGQTGQTAIDFPQPQSSTDSFMAAPPSSPWRPEVGSTAAFVSLPQELGAMALPDSTFVPTAQPAVQKGSEIGFSPSRVPPGFSTQLPTEANSSAVIQTLLQSRLFSANQGLDPKHRRPFTVSFPVGPVSVGVGLDVCRLHTAEVSLEGAEISDPQQPCFLLYRGQTEHGVLVGLGAKGASVGATLYGGGKRGMDVAFRRNVDRLEDRRSLQNACWEQRTPKQDPSLTPWFKIPEPHEPEHFAIGDMWEQTAVHHFQGGLIVGSMAQKVDLGMTVAGHFVVRVEKVAADTMRCTVIPLKYRRLRIESGNLAESISGARDETEGNSVTFQFRVDTAGGRRAYLALLDGQLPPQSHPSPEHSDKPVALIGRESVNSTTARWQMQLLRGNLALGGSSLDGTQHFETAAGRQSIHQTSTERQKSNWHGVERHEWEVFALYNHLAEPSGLERRCFREMLLYLNFGLQPAERGLRRRHNGERLAKTRQQQLVSLARSLNTGMPALTTVQTEGHFAVEVFVSLDSEHINILANKTEQEVADAAWRNHIDEDRAKEVAKSFAMIRALEQRQRLSERQALESAARAGAAPSPEHNPALRATFDQLELDTTAEQAPVLAAMLKQADALSLVTYLLKDPAAASADPGANPTTGSRPLRISHTVDCQAYDDADRVLRDVPQLEEFIAAEPGESPESQQRLVAALKRLSEGSKLLSRGLQTASGDPLSAHWEPTLWRSRQARWREGLHDLRDLGSARALALREDQGDILLTHGTLYKVATMDQRISLLLRRWQALQNPSSKQVDTLAKLLDDCLEEVHDTLKELDEELQEGAPLDYLTRWEGLHLLALVSQVESQPQVAAHSKIRRQLRQMEELTSEACQRRFRATLPDDWQDRQLGDNALDGFRLGSASV